MDRKAMYKLSYGLFILTAKEAGDYVDTIDETLEKQFGAFHIKLTPQLTYVAFRGTDDNTKWAGKTVHFAREIDSTNLWGKRAWREEGAGHGELFVAEYQSAGRGRFTRRWSAPPDSAITMSILICPEFSPQKAPMLTLVMGLGVRFIP